MFRLISLLWYSLLMIACTAAIIAAINPLALMAALAAIQVYLS